MYDNRIAGFFGDYRWLSNFWLCDIEYKGITFPSVEHAYVYAKCNLSTEQLDKLLVSTPGQAKRLGRTAPANPQFSRNKLVIMKKLLEIKFSHINLQQKLIDTHPAALIEVNNWGDTFWGVNDQGTGLNHLGYLLEEVRDSYREYLLKAD